LGENTDEETHETATNEEKSSEQEKDVGKDSPAKALTQDLVS